MRERRMEENKKELQPGKSAFKLFTSINKCRRSNARRVKLLCVAKFPRLFSLNYCVKLTFDGVLLDSLLKRFMCDELQSTLFLNPTSFHFSLCLVIISPPKEAETVIKSSSSRDFAFMSLHMNVFKEIIVD